MSFVKRMYEYAKAFLQQGLERWETEGVGDCWLLTPRETIVRTWLITHYVSHCGGQAGRALAAELGSFERPTTTPSPP